MSEKAAYGSNFEENPTSRKSPQLVDWPDNKLIEAGGSTSLINISLKTLIIKKVVGFQLAW